MAKKTLNKEAKKAAMKKAAAAKETTREADSIRTQEQTKAAESPGRILAGDITAVPLSQIVLDRYQPRPVLPVSGGLRDKFFSGELGWKETARRWLEMASSDPPMKRQVDALLEMGESIEKLNQIEPATGAWRETDDGEYKLILLTGERRFWSVGLAAVANNAPREPRLECREIEEKDLSPERQIVENETAEPLSAVGKARAIAALILERLDLPPELDRNSKNPPTDYEYYQSVLDIEKITGSKYMPRGIWEEVGEIMNMGRPYMTHHLNLLNLPEELQHRADLHDLSEGVLREILKLPASRWEEAIRRTAAEELTAADIKKIGAGKEKRKTKTKKLSPAEKAARRMKSFWRVTKEIKSENEIGQLATEFAAGLDREEILSGADVLESIAQKLRLRAGD